MPSIPQKSEARIAIEPDFVWDRQDAYLFDIDGTLLSNWDSVHWDSFEASIRRMTGFEVTLTGIPIAGSTDSAILRAACQQAGVPVEIVEKNVDAILDAMCSSVSARQHEMRVALMPGVATGNLETIGWIKIERAGLREWFRFGGFSDRFPIRSDLIGQAARKARELAGHNSTVCVVGDTPRDIEAAHANSLPVIAVATGRSSFDELLEAKPEACASTLADLLAATKGGAR